ASSGSALSVFNGEVVDAAGVWKLWVADDALADTGQFAGGWCIHVTTSGANPTNTPTTPPAPTNTPTRTPTNPPAATNTPTRTPTTAAATSTPTATPVSSSVSVCSVGTPVAIPDNTGASATSQITNGPSMLIGDLNVRLNVTHTWIGDLKITLN